MWPVILRELRAGSRRWTTYWLRLLAAGAVVGAVMFWFENGSNSRTAGSIVFTLMHRIVLGAIWILVPLMTCDCLSSEKREGTLGLLFLTNLSARQIVFAKAAAHGLRAFTLWLAVIPIIGIPVLLGGLGWKEIVLSCSLAFGSICVALAAGLLASVLANRMNGAVAWAAALTPLGWLVFTAGNLLFHGTCGFLIGAMNQQGFSEMASFRNFKTAMMFLSNHDDLWRQVFGRTGKFDTAVLLGSALLVPVAALFLWLFCAVVIAPIIRRNWQDKPKTKRQTETEKFFCSPVFLTGLFRRWMRRSLDHNPIGWLEKRSWSGRIMAWIALSVMISFSSLFAYTAASHEDSQVFNGLMWALLVSIAFVAAGSFRRERETGAMELILVTPLSERQIIFGRLRGLWSQFLPTFLLWAIVVVYLSSALKDWQVVNLIRFTVLYLVVPVIGLYFSLRSRFVLLSWIATLAVCFALPQIMWWTFREAIIIFETIGSDGLVNVGLPAQQIAAIPFQLALAAFFLWRLRVNLVRRTFSFR